MARNTVEQTPAARLLAQVERDERMAEKGQDLIEKLCLPRDHHERRAWTMSIPARPDYDPDLVLGSALGIVPRQAAQLQVLVEALALIRKHARHPDRMSDGTHVDPMTTLAAIYAHSGRALEAAAAMMSGDEG